MVMLGLLFVSTGLVNDRRVGCCLGLSSHKMVIFDSPRSKDGDEQNCCLELSCLVWRGSPHLCLVHNLQEPRACHLKLKLALRVAGCLGLIRHYYK